MKKNPVLNVVFNGFKTLKFTCPHCVTFKRVDSSNMYLPISLSLLYLWFYNQTLIPDATVVLLSSDVECCAREIWTPRRGIATESDLKLFFIEINQNWNFDKEKINQTWNFKFHLKQWSLLFFSRMVIGSVERNHNTKPYYSS